MNTWPRFAREVIADAVRATPTEHIQPPAGADRPHSGVFVTLRKGRNLRGCMGTLDATLELADATRQAAINAALHDPRFPPIQPNELSSVAVEVSILSAPTTMRTLDDLVLGRHGVIVSSGHRRGLFLPQVATDHRMDKLTFLSRCCSEKAGLPPDAWRSPEVEVQLFEAEKHSE